MDFIYRRAYHEIHHYGDVTYPNRVERLSKRVIASFIYPFAWIAKKIVQFLGEHSTNGLMGRWAITSTVYHKDYIFPLTEVEFEGHMFYAPGNWHQHLSDVYGDYMQIPAPENRKQIFDMKLVKIED